MSAARVRLRPNTTTATRSVELETNGDLVERQVRREQVGRGDRYGERKERDEQQQQVQPHQVRAGCLDKPGQVAVRDPYPAMNAKLTK